MFTEGVLCAYCLKIHPKVWHSTLNLTQDFFFFFSYITLISLTDLDSYFIKGPYLKVRLFFFFFLNINGEPLNLYCISQENLVFVREVFSG